MKFEKFSFVEHLKLPLVHPNVFADSYASGIWRAVVLILERLDVFNINFMLSNWIRNWPSPIAKSSS